MSALREEALMQMRLRGFSPNTVESYIQKLEELCRFYWKGLGQLSCHEVQKFLDHLIRKRKLAWSTINVYCSAYRFLYEQVLKRPPKEFSIPPRSRSRKRPGIYSREDTFRIIEAPKNLKHRALLSMTYGSGLRVSEVIKVLPVDVDRGRMMLKVLGKGHKERYTLLAQHTLNLLEEHWHMNRPRGYFFFGCDKLKPMSVTTAQRVYNDAVKRAGLRKVGGIHTLRHCFASHALEDGHDLFDIKRWLGHNALTTTGRYMHVVPGTRGKVISPLDMPISKA